MRVADILHIQAEAALLLVGAHNSKDSLAPEGIRRQLLQVLCQPPPALGSSTARKLLGSRLVSRQHLDLEELCIYISTTTRSSSKWTLTCHLCVVRNVQRVEG